MITLICGLPNAGKTTYSSSHANVIHFDEASRNGDQFVNCNRTASKVQGDVCVEGIYNSARRRKQLLEACKHQDRKVCIWLDTPLEECIEREKSYRKRPTGIVHAHYWSFEPPTLDEGWDEIIVIKGEQQWHTNQQHGHMVKR